MGDGDLRLGDTTELAAAVGKSLGATLEAKPEARVHGGSINESHRWQSTAGPLFVKVAPVAARALSLLVCHGRSRPV